LYKNRKETAIYKRRKNKQKVQKIYKNTEYTKLDNKNTKQKANIKRIFKKSSI